MINIQNNDDNVCFKWCFVKCVNPVDNDPRKIKEANTELAKRLDFKFAKFPFKIRDIHKIAKENSVGVSVFDYKNKDKYPMYIQKTCCQENHID